MKYYSPRCWVHYSDHRDGKAEPLSSQGYISPTLECPRRDVEILGPQGLAHAGWKVLAGRGFAWLTLCKLSEEQDYGGLSLLYRHQGASMQDSHAGWK